MPWRFPWIATAGSEAVAFLCGTGRDTRKKTITDVISATDGELERRHNYIQWLFPLQEPSLAVLSSPILSDQDVAAICNSAAAQANLLRASERMLAFYRTNQHWLREHDHNHLRITRIIKSLRLLVGDVEADRFKAAIGSLVAASHAPINSTTLSFWDRA
jgi:hypothetical protein